MEIVGKRALVVGGASGLAKATVEMLVAEGAKVAILDLPSSSGQQLANRLGNRTVFCPCDIADHGETEDAVNRAVNELEGLDIGVNVAGGGAGPRRVVNVEGPYPLDTFRRVVELNLVATFNLTRLEAWLMTRSTRSPGEEGGVIVNTSSNAAFGGPVGVSPYAVSKAAVAALSLAVARDLAPYRIRVMAIAPSMFETGILRMLDDVQKEALLAEAVFPKRMGQPHEFAHLVKTVIQNPMLNADTIRLDGGTHRAIKDNLNDALF